jgi:amino acid transporter
LPRFLSLRLKATDCPWAATTLTATAAIIFLIAGDPVWMIAAANFTYLIGICMPNIAAYLLRRDLPDAERPIGLPAAPSYLASSPR